MLQSAGTRTMHRQQIHSLNFTRIVANLHRTKKARHNYVVDVLSKCTVCKISASAPFHVASSLSASRGVNSIQNDVIIGSPGCRPGDTVIQIRPERPTVVGAATLLCCCAQRQNTDGAHLSASDIAVLNAADLCNCKTWKNNHPCGLEKDRVRENRGKGGTTAGFWLL